jgi:ABC-type transporter Mla subunit MlaD
MTGSTERDRRRALAFVGGSLLLFLSVLALLGGVRLARHDRTYYVAVPDSVSGLRAASTIEYKGVPVGVVRGIAFRSGSVEAVQVEMAIRPGVPIKADTRARLRPQGITGLNILELTGGTTSAPDLPEGAEIAIEASVFAELEGTMHDVATLVRRLTDLTANVSSDAQAAVKEMRGALVAVRDAARTLDASTAAIGSEAALSAASFRAAADDVHAILKDPAWASLGGEALAGVADARRAIAKLERAADDVERVLKENRGDLRDSMQSLKRASGDVRAAARRVRESPASLVVEHPPAEKPSPDPLPPLGGSGR